MLELILYLDINGGYSIESQVVQCGGCLSKRSILSWILRQKKKKKKLTFKCHVAMLELYYNNILNTINFFCKSITYTRFSKHMQFRKEDSKSVTYITYNNNSLSTQHTVLYYCITYYR